ncbi:hypothetical protein FRX31_033371, partial [Thalictrum thalictroides]
MATVFKPTSKSKLSFSIITPKLGFEPQNPPPKPPTMVFWTRPSEGVLALHTDGAAINGLSVGRGLLRDHM